MKFARNLLGTLRFQGSALRGLAASQDLPASFACLIMGLLAFMLVRNSVYAGLREPGTAVMPGILGSLVDFNLLQILLFFTLIYVPALVCLSNAFAGDGLGLSISRQEYREHIAALFPLWGALLLVVSPLQFLQIKVLDILLVSLGLLVLILFMAVYSVWAVRELNYISTLAACAVFLLSWITLPLFYLLSAFVFALPLFILIPLAYILFHRLRDYFAGRGSEREFQEHLRTLALNPQDADAQHQLGLIRFKRGYFDEAQDYFTKALKIDPSDPDYHYYLGRTFEAKGDWSRALEQYEETYRIDTGYALGDIFREVGKGYLHSGKLLKAVEFLRYFLETRVSDPEGRFWLAVALQKSGDFEGMRVQLRTILEQARTNPRFFLKENRRWIYRARALLRS